MGRQEAYRVAGDKSETVAAIPAACSDEHTAVEFMERQRWADSPACPRCGDTDVYQVIDRKTGRRSKRFLWDCRGCRRQFTVRIGTILEDSRIPLRHWCYAFWAACASKKGASALQIKRQIGVSYKAALFMMLRIRWAMAEDHSLVPKLQGTVEAEEAFVGGKPRNQGSGKRLRGRGTTKACILALVERGGDVRLTRHP